MPGIRLVAPISVGYIITAIAAHGAPMLFQSQVIVGTISQSRDSGLLNAFSQLNQLSEHNCPGTPFCGTMDSFAAVSPGLLRASAVAVMQVDPGGAGGPVQSAASGQARFREEVVVQSATLAPGTMVMLSFDQALTGVLSGTGDFAEGSVNSQVYFGGTLVSLVMGSGGTGTPVFTRMSNSFSAVVGGTYYVEAGLTVIARAVNNSTSVVDYSSGTHPFLMRGSADVTLLSASGFDYSPQSSVPETSTLWLCMLGLCCIGAAKHVV